MLHRENKIELSDANETSAADVIEETLTMHHITQKDFAKRIGVSQKHLSMVLNRKAFVSATVALSIEEVTGIPAKILLRLDTNYHLKHTVLSADDKKATDSEYLKQYDWATA